MFYHRRESVGCLIYINVGWICRWFTAAFRGGHLVCEERIAASCEVEQARAGLGGSIGQMLELGAADACRLRSHAWACHARLSRHALVSAMVSKSCSSSMP